MNVHAREFVLDPGIHFLNHGSFGATPRRILDERRRWELEMERQPVAFFWDRSSTLVREAAIRAAAWVGVAADDIVLVENATTGVDAVLRGRRWRSGDRVVTLSHGYNAVRQAVAFLRDQYGVEPTIVEVPFPIYDPDELLRPLARALEGASMAVLDHITSPTGLVLPIHAMVKLCRLAGVPVLVDGAHAPGQVPLQVAEIGADWYTGNLHKWAFAPKGSAFLYVAPHRRAETPPLTVSHGYRGTLSEAFEWTGTRDPSGWLAIPAALDLHQEWGGPALMDANLTKQQAATEEWCHDWGLEEPAPAAWRAALSALPLPRGVIEPTDEATRAFSRALWSHYRVEVPIIPFGGRAWARISAQIYNDDADYAALQRSVRGLLSEKPFRLP